MEEARRGIKLIEVMAILAILAIVLGVVLPIFQRSREEARRTECVRNLKQIGLALHGYHAAFGCLPPAGESCSGIGGVTGPQNFSIKARILPFMEMMPVYNSINFAVSAAWNNNSPQSTVDGQFMNATVRSVRIYSYICPSDVNESSSPSDLHGPASSYAENRGTGRYYNNWNASGIAYYPGCDPHLNRTVTFDRITDGLSQTAAFSEFVKGKGTMNQDGLHMVYAGDVAAFAYNQADGDRKTAESCQNSSTFRWDYKGEHWMVSDSGRGGGYFHIQRPNRKACAGPGGFDSVIGASSYHPGGVNVLMMDGAVMFAKNGVSFEIWRGIGTIDMGEVIPGDWLID